MVKKEAKTGTREWSEYSINIQRGCEHNCRYCYAKYNAVKRFKICEDRHWCLPRVNEKKVDLPHKRKYGGVVMYPTTHDITPVNLNQYLCVLRKLLDAGNQVLIVTKPHWDCVTVICEAYAEYKDQIMFRFTIGSQDDEILSFWEPGAPNFAERLGCLQYAHKSGFKTSVSCEPYLDPYVIYTYTACKPFITDSFWVGKMRGINSRVNLDGVTDYQVRRFVEPLKSALSDGVVKSFYRLLDGQPFIRWKDSVREVVGL